MTVTVAIIFERVALIAASRDPFRNTWALGTRTGPLMPCVSQFRKQIDAPRAGAVSIIHHQS
jgi:hypothetical protein